MVTSIQRARGRRMSWSSGRFYGLVAPFLDMWPRAAERLFDRPTGSIGSSRPAKLKSRASTLFGRAISGAARAPRTSSRRWPRRTYARRIQATGIVGAVLYGDTATGGWYYDLMKKMRGFSLFRDMAHLRPVYALGGGQADPKGPLRPLGRARSACNGVNRGRCRHDRGRRLHSRLRWRGGCKLPASCGSAPGWSRAPWLALTAGRRLFRLRTTRTMCKCHSSATMTSPRHRRAGPCARSTGDAGTELSHADGCSSFALPQFIYLLCAWPGEISGRPQSHLLQRTLHCQHPRRTAPIRCAAQWGGITARRAAARSPTSSINICAVVKVPGRQRLRHLRDQRRKICPPVWAELMPPGLLSRPCYGGLRTLTTCRRLDGASSGRMILPASA